MYAKSKVKCSIQYPKIIVFTTTIITQSFKCLQYGYNIRKYIYLPSSYRNLTLFSILFILRFR